MSEEIFVGDARESDALYYLDVEDMEIDTLLESWDSGVRRAKMRRGRKTGCRHGWVPRPTAPMDVVFARVPRRSIQANPAADAISAELARELAPYLSHTVVWGQCFLGEQRDPVPEFVTLYAPLECSVYMRGVYGSEYDVCACGLPELKSDGSESQVEYITRDQLRANEHAYLVDGYRGLVVTPMLKKILPWHKFPDISLVSYPVESVPLDGEHFEIDDRRAEICCK
jgi:hypothetical protein